MEDIEMKSVEKQADTETDIQEAHSAAENVAAGQLDLGNVNSVKTESDLEATPQLVAKLESETQSTDEDAVKAKVEPNNCAQIDHEMEGTRFDVLDMVEETIDDETGAAENTNGSESARDGNLESGARYGAASVGSSAAADDSDLEEVCYEADNAEQLADFDECYVAERPRYASKTRLPAGWKEVYHESGATIYVHLETNVCSLSRPYILGSGSTKNHVLPGSAVPCYSYKMSEEWDLLEEEEAVAAADADSADGQTKSCGGDDNVEAVGADAAAPAGASATTPADLNTTAEAGAAVTTSAGVPAAAPADLNTAAPADAATAAPTGSSTVASVDTSATAGAADSSAAAPTSLGTAAPNAAAAAAAASCPGAAAASTSAAAAAASTSAAAAAASTSAAAAAATTSAAAAAATTSAAAAGTFGPAAAAEGEREAVDRKEEEKLIQYCKRLFRFKTIKYLKFRSWDVRRTYLRALRNERNRRKCPIYNRKCWSMPIEMKDDDGNVLSTKKWFMNPRGRSYVAILHEYLQQSKKTQPEYKFSEVDNARTPYAATVVVNGVEYGSGVGMSKKEAKFEAAKATLQVLLPKMMKYVLSACCDPGKSSENKLDEASDEELPAENVASVFDDIEITDPRVTELSVQTTEPKPFGLLLQCVQKKGYQRHDVKFDFQDEAAECTMRLQEHTVTVKCDNKRDGRQLAAQALLRKLHPHVSNWGSLLRLYGNAVANQYREVNEDRDVEELKARPLSKELLNFLRERMAVLRDQNGSEVPGED